jgi:hypothetical protein
LLRARDRAEIERWLLASRGAGLAGVDTR